MLNTLKLLLPCLMPSWAFFRSVDPSPRIEWRALSAARETDVPWRPFRPRPARISCLEHLRRLVWNPRWNETLFLVSLAERILVTPDAHSIHQIRQRLGRQIATPTPDTSARPAYLQFRLVLVDRIDSVLVRDLAYVDPPFKIRADPP